MVSFMIPGEHCLFVEWLASDYAFYIIKVLLFCILDWPLVILLTFVPGLER